MNPADLFELGVPDAELYLRKYAENSTEFFQGLAHLGGAAKPLSVPIDVINQMFGIGGHHLFAWDDDTLSSALESIGFTGVARWAPGQAFSAEICPDNLAHYF